ncbi:myb-binding protein 1A [Platysternon megacephalum]|uniref:Myb-binding protein 1A n=1 Tax=Platysternon megacephalum TaxID=55544 RepID=A0A4D9F611_9SAUR|nr:myb-binding protein 1A [Platysternon megacephalum]
MLRPARPRSPPAIFLAESPTSREGGTTLRAPSLLRFLCPGPKTNYWEEAAAADLPARRCMALREAASPTPPPLPVAFAVTSLKPIEIFCAVSPPFVQILPSPLLRSPRPLLDAPPRERGQQRLAVASPIPFIRLAAAPAASSAQPWL